MGALAGRASVGPDSGDGLSVHEMSVALEICRIAEAEVGRAGLADVVAIGVEVGDASGLEVGNLEFCLEALLERPPFGRARPRITRCQGDDLRVEYLEVDDGEPDGGG